MQGTTTAAATVSAGRSGWAWVRLLGGVAILALLVWRLGTGPFLDGVRTIDAPALLTAFGIGVVTTTCCAWRWSLVARGLGVRLPLPGAVAAYYRSQFLNTTLPGGVVGDVHRAMRHGLDIGDLGRSVRAVVLERVAGQVVQIAIAVVVLLVLPSPVRAHLPLAVAVGLAIGLGLALLARRAGKGRHRGLLHRAATDVRDGLVAGGNWSGVLLASTVVVAGHLATFLLAARTAGATASVSVLLPLGLLALLAMAIPLNIAGWGPREGVAAWAFAAAGLTATQGVATAVVYGVLVLVASLPGAGVLVAGWLNRTGAEPAPARVPALGPGGPRG